MHRAIAQTQDTELSSDRTTSQPATQPAKGVATTQPATTTQPVMLAEPRKPYEEPLGWMLLFYLVVHFAVRRKAGFFTNDHFLDTKPEEGRGLAVYDLALFSVCAVSFLVLAMGGGKLLQFAAIPQMVALGYGLMRLVTSRELAESKRLFFGFTGDQRRNWIFAKTLLEGIFIVIPMAMVGAFLLNIFLYSIGVEMPAVAHESLKKLRDDPTREAILAILITAVAVAPVIEEIVYRGLLNIGLRESFPKVSRWLLIVAGAVIFALMHAAVVSWHAFVPLTILGIGWGYLTEKSGSLIPAIVSHMVFNALNIVFALYLMP